MSTILLWGLPGDKPIAQVRDALRRHSTRTVFFDQRDVLQAELEITECEQIDGLLCIGDETLDLAEISAVYMRLYSPAQLPRLSGLTPTDPALRHANAIHEGLVGWSEVTPALVVNRTSAMASNGSKPYQLGILRNGGFEVPATLLTTDPAAAREFWQKHEVVVYKSISGVRSAVSRLSAEHEPRLERVRWCPTQFQQFVPGTDYRVHVVGDAVFAAEIDSPADDYRYARQQGANVEIRAYALAADIADRCRALTRYLGLAVSGIDLRRHPNGAWYCFEVNPSPAFSYFQDATGQAIDRAIADLLAGETAVSTAPIGKKELR